MSEYLITIDGSVILAYFESTPYFQCSKRNVFILVRVFAAKKKLPGQRAYRCSVPFVIHISKCIINHSRPVQLTSGKVVGEVDH
jgi:hypothetical protein